MESSHIKTIKVLPIREMFFLKKICLEDTLSSDIVCYARKVSHDYRLTPKDGSYGKYLHLGYKEDEYPFDELDKEILGMIKEKFPNAKPHTSLMMFNVNKEYNAQWINQYKKETLNVVIEFIPASGSITGADVCRKEIEVLSLPTMRGLQRRFNANIHISTGSPEKYSRLRALLNGTYNLFSEVIE